MEIFGLGGWLGWRLRFDPRGGVSVRDWLAAPWQRLAEVTAGAVFHDGPGELTRARTALSWHPPGVWRYVLSCDHRPRSAVTSHRGQVGCTVSGI